MEDLLPDAIKADRVGITIADQPRVFRSKDGNKREYHAITRGWIANELFRRVDPAGRTIGEFIQEAVSTPLGVDVAIGLRQPELDDEARILTALETVQAGQFVRERGGLFAYGDAEERSPSAPYKPLGSALAELVSNLRRDDPARLARFAARMKRELVKAYKHRQGQTS